jgi:transposase
VITGFVASKSRIHDTRHAEKLLRQCHKTRKSDCYVMDKGYDSEAIHRLIREDLHANSVIPIRSWNNDIIGGTYRREMAQQFNDVVYPRRQIVENKFSVLKRKFSGDLKARRFLIQTKEIANKMIVCNIHRFLQFLIVEVFYRAQFYYYLFCSVLVDVVVNHRDPSNSKEVMKIVRAIHTIQLLILEQGLFPILK